MTEYQTIRYETASNIATLTLNRPDRLNGVTNTMMRELHEALTAASLDQDLRVLVLTGAGRGFCPGADLGHYSSGEADEPLLPEYFNLTALLHESRCVTIAAINGACAGAGLGWACACDLRYAARSANFNAAFLDVAISGDMAGPWTLPRIVGAARARELYFLPGKFDAMEAERIGLVSRVFPDDSFRHEVAAIAGRIAGSAPPGAPRDEGQLPRRRDHGAPRLHRDRDRAAQPHRRNPRLAGGLPRLRRETHPPLRRALVWAGGWRIAG